MCIRCARSRSARSIRARCGSSAASGCSRYCRPTTAIEPWHSTPYQALPLVYVQNASLEIAWTSVVFERHSIAGDVLVPFITDGLRRVRHQRSARLDDRGAAHRGRRRAVASGSSISVHLGDCLKSLNHEDHEDHEAKHQEAWLRRPMGDIQTDQGESLELQYVPVSEFQRLLQSGADAVAARARLCRAGAHQHALHDRGRMVRPHRHELQLARDHELAVSQRAARSGQGPGRVRRVLLLEGARRAGTLQRADRPRAAAGREAPPAPAPARAARPPARRDAVHPGEHRLARDGDFEGERDGPGQPPERHASAASSCSPATASYRKGSSGNRLGPRPTAASARSSPSSITTRFSRTPGSRPSAISGTLKQSSARSAGTWCAATVMTLAALQRTFRSLDAVKDTPKVIVADTVKGKGVSFMEGPATKSGELYGFHSGAPSEQSYTAGVTELLAAANDLFRDIGLGAVATETRTRNPRREPRQTDNLVAAYERALVQQAEQPSASDGARRRSGQGLRPDGVCRTASLTGSSSAGLPSRTWRRWRREWPVAACCRSCTPSPAFSPPGRTSRFTTSAASARR